MWLYRMGVLFTVIMTPMYSHRVYSLQAVERPSQPPGYDDGKPGDDDGKSYRMGVVATFMAPGGGAKPTIIV